MPNPIQRSPLCSGLRLAKMAIPRYQERDGEEKGGAAEDLPEDIGEIGTDNPSQVVDLGGAG